MTDVTDGTLLSIVGVLILIAGIAWTVVMPASPAVLLIVLGLLVVAWGAVARRKARKIDEMDPTARL